MAHCHTITQSPPSPQASTEVPVHPSPLEVYLINGKKVTVTVDSSDRCDQVLEVSKAGESVMISATVNRGRESSIVHVVLLQ